jgi:type I restriction enzyme S subunit
MSRSWPLVPLGDVLTQYHDFIDTPEARLYPKLSVKLYGRGVVLDAPADGATLRMKRHQIARAGQVILSEIWGKKGAIGFVPPEGDGALCTSHFFLFNVRPDKVGPRYLQAIFTANYLQEQLDAEARGTTGYAAVRPKQLLSAHIPVPPLHEQRRIVARIDALAAKIEEARGLRQQALREAKAILCSAVSGIDERLRGSFPLAQVQDLALQTKGSLRSGPFGSALLHSEFVRHGIPAVGIQDVEENRFVLTRRWNVTPEKANELARYTIRPRDILVTVMGTLGRACVVPDDVPLMISTKHVWTITFDQTKVEPRWVSYWVNFAHEVRDELLGQGTGTAIAGLNGQKILTLSLPAIGPSEQRRIVAELDALQAKVDELKRLQADTAAELDALLPSILDKAFKGEL